METQKQIDEESKAETEKIELEDLEAEMIKAAMDEADRIEAQKIEAQMIEEHMFEVDRIEAQRRKAQMVGDEDDDAPFLGLSFFAKSSEEESPRRNWNPIHEPSSSSGQIKYNFE